MWVGMKANSTLITASSIKFGLAKTSPRLIANLRQAASNAAATQLAEGVVEVARGTLVAVETFKSLAAEALPCLQVAALSSNTRARTATGLAAGSKVPRHTLIAEAACEVWLAAARPCLRVWLAVVVQGSHCTAVTVYYFTHVD